MIRSNQDHSIYVSQSFPMLSRVAKTFVYIPYMLELFIYFSDSKCEDKLLCT